MPLKAMTPEKIALHTDKMNSDLVLQLNRCDVSPLAIATLGEARFTSIMKFQMLGDDGAGVEEAAKTMGLDKAKGIGDLSEIAA